MPDFLGFSNAATAASVLGVTPRCIYQRRGVLKPKPRLTQDDIDRVRRLLAGYSRREVMRLTGYPRVTVDRIAHGLSPTVDPDPGIRVMVAQGMTVRQICQRLGVGPARVIAIRKSMAAVLKPNRVRF